METKSKFVLPSPNFNKKDDVKINFPYLTPCGMTLLPRQKQPPAMYGARGATVPAKFLPNYNAEKAEVEIHVPAEHHFCNNCDMEFQSVNDLNLHISQHENCPLEGCEYIGHPTKMDKHVVDMHPSDVYEKVKKLNTPEEIAAWRNERKKRFPTLANVMQLKLAKEQRLKRGERLEKNKSRFGKPEIRRRAKERNYNEYKERKKTKVMKRKKNYSQNKNKPKSTKKILPIEQHNENSTSTTSADAEDNKQCFGIHMFTGTGSMDDYKHVKSKKIEKNTLVNLLGMYGSESDDESEQESVIDDSQKEFQKSLCDVKADMEMNIQKVVQKEEFQQEKNVPNIETVESTTDQDELNCTQGVGLSQVLENTANLNENSTDEGPDEVPISHVSDIPTTPLNVSEISNDKKIQKHPKSTNQQSKPMRRFQKRSGLNYSLIYKKKPNTILEKLLESEIRHERNVLLQCVRFVCEQNFFGIGSKTKILK